jgi:cytidylate kinase
MAEKAKMPVDEFYKQAINNPAIDKDLDNWQKKLLLEEDDFILDSRIGFFWPIPLGKIRVNIFLSVDREVGGERGLRNARMSDRQFKDAKEVIAVNKERIEVERQRYNTLYGIRNYRSIIHFDFIVDTTDYSPHEVVDEIVKHLRELCSPKASLSV